MRTVFFFCLLFLAFSCQNTPSNAPTDQQEIIETLKNETRYFCERDLEKWQLQWSHQPFTSKMYAGDKAFEEFIGWKAIHQFVVDHITENPQTIPLPATNFDYDIHLLGESAWVFYSKNVEGALIRETRFMVKEDDQWKIARMQTIY